MVEVGLAELSVTECNRSVTTRYSPRHAYVNSLEEQTRDMLWLNSTVLVFPARAMVFKSSDLTDANGIGE